MQPLPYSPAQDVAVPMPAWLAAYERHVHDLRETGRMLHARGWSLGTSSNYSVVVQRDPIRILITASGKDKGRLCPSDFVLVDGQGTPVVADQEKSSAETLLHCVLAEQSDVGSILHTHSVWGTLLSDFHFAEDGFVIEDFEMLKGLEGITSHEHRVWIPILDNSQDIAALSDVVRQRLADGETLPHGFLLRQHGLYTWGHDLFAARRHVEIFEFLFECVARKMALQGVLPSASVH